MCVSRRTDHTERKGRHTLTNFWVSDQGVMQRTYYIQREVDKKIERIRKTHVKYGQQLRTEL